MSAAVSDDPIAEIRATFALQRARRREVALSTAAQRCERLQALHGALHSRRHAVVDALRADFGKCAAETALTEISPVLEEIEFIRRRLAGWMKPQRVRSNLLTLGSRCEVRREPRGQVLVLSPWNYPVYLFLTPLAGAIAAGNVVMLRPSEKVPRTSELLCELISATFDRSEIAAFNGGVEQAEALTALPFDHIFFTGSSAVGRRIAARAAQHHTSVTLELGGKSPAIVDAAASVDHAARVIAWGKFLNAGQTCVCPDHVWVARPVHDAFVAQLQRRLAEFYGATKEARAASPDFARLVDARAWQRVKHLMDASIAAGASVAFGGTVDEAARYIEPTVLTGVTVEMPIMQEEIFGPVLPVLAYDSVDAVLDRISNGDKPLSLYVISDDRAAAEHILNRTSAGGSVVNGTLLHVANPRLPFGGVGVSGFGNYHGEYSFRCFSHERAIVHQGAAARRFPIPHAPYSALSRMAKWLIRRGSDVDP